MRLDHVLPNASRPWMAKRKQLKTGCRCGTLEGRVLPFILHMYNGSEMLVKMYKMWENLYCMQCNSNYKNVMRKFTTQIPKESSFRLLKTYNQILYFRCLHLLFSIRYNSVLLFFFNTMFTSFHFLLFYFNFNFLFYNHLLILFSFLLLFWIYFSLNCKTIKLFFLWFMSCNWLYNNINNYVINNIIM